MRIINFIVACLFVCSTCFGGYSPSYELEQKTHRVAVETVCRAAIDIGSGSTKLCVALVDKETGRTSQILFGEEFPILVGHDFKERKDGTLGNKILQDVENKIRDYRDLALQLGAEKVCGVATAVFRESSNGRAFIDRLSRDLGVDLRVISQQEEGNIGFLTAVAASGSDSNDVIAWDSGSASFQISYCDNEEKLSVYKGPLGGSKVLAEMVSTIQGHEFTSTSSANPATIDDVKGLCKLIQQALPLISNDLQDKIQALNGSVVAIGGGTSLFDMAKIALGKNIFNKEEVWSAIESLVDKTDEELSDYPEQAMLIPKLALLYSVMDYFGFNTVQNYQAIGSTLGMFMDKKYWNNEPKVAAMKVFLQKDPKECVKRIDTVRRAAFDFGGGSIRVLVADVDLKTKNIEKLFSAGIPIQFRLSLAKNQTNEFSSEIQKVAIAAMRTLQEEISQYSPQQFSATATEAFRIANNGLELVQSITQETNVPIEIIDQEDEGRLGFLSAINYSSSDPETTVVVDLGTGSAQITAQGADGSLNTHGMKLGTIALRDMIARQMRNLQTTPDDINPVMKDEALALIQHLEEQFNTLPEGLVTKLKSNEVKVIATCGVLNTPVIRYDSGWDLIQNTLLERKTGDGINEGCAVKGIFAYAFINKFGVEKCFLNNSNREGNTSGMVITEKYWH
jgi:exopolyphosphatase/guanosine-5'-triphosphate,3'-diphosphate pyrophosphatase